MLQKVKLTLIIIAVVGLILDSSYWAYCKWGGDIATSKIVKELGGDTE